MTDQSLCICWFTSKTIEWCYADENS